MKVKDDFNDALEYLYYHIDRLVEKHFFYHHSKQKFTKSTYFKSGDSLLKENELCKLGIGKIFYETDKSIFTRQFNGVLYSKEEYFKNKEHSKMVYSGLYEKPYFGNKKLFIKTKTNSK